MSRAFRIDMTGTQEVPSNDSTATGLGIAVFDDSVVGNPTVDYTINVSGLDFGGQTPAGGDNVTDTHFHLGNVGVAGGVIFDWDSHDLDDYAETI